MYRNKLEKLQIYSWNRPRHKKQIFLGCLEHQEIFRHFGGFKKKMDSGGFLDDLEQNCPTFFAVLFKIPMK